VRLPFAVTKVIGFLKEDTRFPLWTRYSLWFIETLFYDFRWARDRIVQILKWKVSKYEIKKDD